MSSAGAPPQSKLKFPTLGAELAYWLANLTQLFKGGYAGSGENGVDIGMPYFTPVYAIEGGTVKGAGYYAGGGVTSIRASPGRVWYYQHLDLNLLREGDTVQAGDLIGYSGGQLSGGFHPSDRAHSSGPHIEVGINYPAGGIWGGGEGANVDPLPYIKALAPGLAGVATHTVFPSGVVQLGSLNPLDAINNTLSGIGNVFQGLGDFFKGGGLIRIAKVATGILLILGATLITFLPDVAAGVAVASGRPELARTARAAGRLRFRQTGREGIRAAAAAQPKAKAAAERRDVQRAKAEKLGEVEARVQLAREQAKKEGRDEAEAAAAARRSEIGKRAAATRRANAAAGTAPKGKTANKGNPSTPAESRNVVQQAQRSGQRIRFPGEK